MEQRQFGAFICELRKEKGMTQKELGEKLGITDKAISKWERGQTLPDITMLEKIAEQLSVSVVELMQAKKIPEEKISKEDAENAVHETVSQAKKQALQKNRRVMAVTACVAVLVCIGARLALKMANRALDAWAQENESLAHSCELAPVYSYDASDGYYVYREQIEDFLWDYHVACVGKNGEAEDLFVLREKGMDLDRSPKLIRSGNMLYVLFEGIDNEDPAERLYDGKVGADIQGLMPYLYAFDLQSGSLDKITIENKTEMMIIDAFQMDGKTVYIGQRFKGVFGGLHLGFYMGDSVFASFRGGREYADLFGDGGLKSTGVVADNRYFVLAQKGIYQIRLDTGKGNYVKKADYSKCHRAELHLMEWGGETYYVLAASYFDTWDEFHNPLTFRTTVTVFNQDWKTVNEMTIPIGISGLEWGEKSLIISGPDSEGQKSFYVQPAKGETEELTQITHPQERNLEQLDLLERVKEQWVYLPEEGGYYFMGEKPVFLEEK